MILPSKHLSQERALLTVGAMILKHISPSPTTVSSLWEKVKSVENGQRAFRPISYDGFILALDLLFLINSIDYREGRIFRRKS